MNWGPMFTSTAHKRQGIVSTAQRTVQPNRRALVRYSESSATCHDGRTKSSQNSPDTLLSTMTRGRLTLVTHFPSPSKRTNLGVRYVLDYSNSVKQGLSSHICLSRMIYGFTSLIDGRFTAPGSLQSYGVHSHSDHYGF